MSTLAAWPIVPTGGLKPKNENFKLKYTSHGSEDRLELFVAQNNSDPKGGISGIQIEIPGSERNGSFFQLALAASRGNAEALGEQLKEKGFLVSETWPASHALVNLKGQTKLLLPTLPAEDEAPNTEQRGKPVLDALITRGLITEKTANALNTAIAAFAASKPGKLKESRLYNELDQILPAQEHSSAL